MDKGTDWIYFGYALEMAAGASFMSKDAMSLAREIERNGSCTASVAIDMLVEIAQLRHEAAQKDG